MSLQSYVSVTAPEYRIVSIHFLWLLAEMEAGVNPESLPEAQGARGVVRWTCAQTRLEHHLEDLIHLNHVSLHRWRKMGPLESREGCKEFDIGGWGREAADFPRERMWCVLRQQ